MTKPVLLIRANRNEDDAKTLSELGFETVIDPYLTIEPTQDGDAVNQVLAALASADERTWFVLTSANGIHYLAAAIGRDALTTALADSSARFAAIGESTKLVLQNYGVQEILTPEVADSKHLADSLLALGPGTAIWPRSAIAMKSFPNQLVEAGWQLIDPAVYETKTIETEPESARRALEGDFSAIIVLSPSAGRALAKYVPPTALTSVGTEIVCMGETTATALKQMGFSVVRVATTIRGAFE